MVLRSFCLPSFIWKIGEVFLLTVGASLLTVELLCLQSVEAFLSGTFPLEAKKLICRKKNSNCK